MLGNAVEGKTQRVARWEMITEEVLYFVFIALMFIGLICCAIGVANARVKEIEDIEEELNKIKDRVKE